MGGEMLDSGSAEALGQLVASRRALVELEAELVVRARRNGATWSDIAEPLGLSKQAVRKRHLAIDPIYAQRRRPTTAAYHAELAG
jgi:hypothetical protein